MKWNRRDWLLATAVGGLATTRATNLHAAKPAALSPAQFAETLAARTAWQREVDDALQRAAKVLVAAQSKDGAWRSETYGALRDGPSLTPTISTTLYYLPQGGHAARAAYSRGKDYLLTLVEDDGRLQTELYDFPIYTAAAASWAIVLAGRDERTRVAQQAWIRFLRARQFTEPLGWSPADLPYGGWGYSVRPPQKPAPGQPAPPLLDANLSATLFVLGALANAMVSTNDLAITKARTFIERCQNFTDPDAAHDDPTSDGGFFFSTTDPARNKAGEISTRTAAAPVRYHSYGSATADGLRALFRTGASADHPRAIAAAGWLRRHFSATANPGKFNEDRQRLRNSYYYYYCWSTAHALLHLGETKFSTGDGKPVDWPRALATELLRRQRRDGSWTNRFTDAKEDDPLVATSLAAATLAVCRLAEEQSRRS